MSLKLVFRRIIGSMIIPAMVAAAFFSTAMPVVATDTEETLVDENAESQEGATLLNDVFGEVVFYRWDRVYRNDYPTDSDWHLVMLVWSRSDGTIDDGYIGALAPDDIWQGPEAAAVPGVTHRFTEDNEIYDKYFDDKKWIKEKDTYYIRLTDRAEGIDIGSDPQVQTYRNTFFTDDDRDCLYIKYSKRDSDNEGEDGLQAPVYYMKMSKSPNAPADYDYVIEPWGDEDNSAIAFHANESGRDEWTFKSESKSRGDVWRVFYNKESARDPTLSVGEGLRFAHVRSQDKDWNLFKMFIGTKLRFSSINGDVNIQSGQILSISPSNYVSSTGSTESQSGVILPGGNTITIEKGGILSISGDFINNGTIINNGGTIIVQNGGTIYPFLQGDDNNSLGCGSIKCNSGDIIVEDGGAIYSGMNCAMTTDNVQRSAAFWLDNSSTLVNYGLVCCGQVDLGDATVVENRSNGRIYTCLYEPSWGTFTYQLSDNNSKLMSGSTDDLKSLGYFDTGTDYYGGITIIGGPTKLTNAPSIYTAKDMGGNLNNPDSDWQDVYISQGLIYYGTLEL